MLDHTRTRLAHEARSSVLIDFDFPQMLTARQMAQPCYLHLCPSQLKLPLRA